MGATKRRTSWSSVYMLDPDCFVTQLSPPFPLVPLVQLLHPAWCFGWNSHLTSVDLSEVRICPELQFFAALFHLRGIHIDLVCIAKDLLQSSPWALERAERPVNNTTRSWKHGWLHRYSSSSPFPVSWYQTEVKKQWNTRVMAATLRTRKPQV